MEWMKLKIQNLDPSCCFICDQKHHGIEGWMLDMHKKHGFFIHVVQYLKAVKGFFTYVGLMVAGHLHLLNVVF